MKQLLLLSILLITASCVEREQKRGAVESFALTDVELLDSPFREAQQTDLRYMLALDPDRLLAPFRREAGLPAAAPPYGNWENTGLDGHIGGHYLSALSMMYAATGDREVKRRLDYMLDELKRCQQAGGDGYIGGVPGGRALWDEVAAGTIRPSKHELNGKWVPLYNIHKTYAGLRDAWIHTGSETAKELLVGMTDWAVRLVSQLSDEQVQQMLDSEYGGLNETFADAAAITGEPRYLHLARRFSHRAILDPLLRGEDRLEGLHANTQIPKVIGFKRIADLTGDTEWSQAAAFFWDAVVANRSVSIGGNSVNEHFHPTDDFSRMMHEIQGPETCNTYNMLRLSKMLYKSSADKKYIDYYERALYNHILSAQHPENGGLVYFTQMRPGHYRVYSQPETAMWCCVGSGMENHARYGEAIYARRGDELLVNLFIPSRLQWGEQQTEIVQENRFPDQASTVLTINPVGRRRFTLSVRCPDWVEAGELRIRVNGEEQPAEPDAAGYVSLTRRWKRGDRVEVDLPMHLRAEQLPDGSAWYSFACGPVVLAAKTGTEDLEGLYAADSRMGHVARGRTIPADELPVLRGGADGLTDRLVPVSDRPLTFRLTGLHPQERWGSLELIPFFRLHDARYIIYWPLEP
jgi:DUF1680 family protein